jgi:hypothetical protein
MLLVIDGIDLEIGISALPKKNYKQVTTSSVLTVESFTEAWSRYHSIFAALNVYGIAVLWSTLNR